MSHNPVEETPNELPLSITNTSKRAAQGDLVMGFIEATERAGQVELVLSEMLPTQTDKPELWVLLGFVLGEPDPEDPLFRKAAFPKGWRKVSTDHSLHTDIVDAQGCVRGHIFYKAAFYDRRAYASLCPRYHVISYTGGGRVVPRVVDRKHVDKSPFTSTCTDLEDRDQFDKAQNSCWTWIKELEATVVHPFALWDCP